jgi:predicted nucleic acid-binding protein
MDELLRVLDYPRIKRRLPLDKNIYANFVLMISTPIVATVFHVNSPDKEDDYLYDIALTAHAKLLVTGEKASLEWAHSPVETINLTTFKELF